MIPKTEEMDMKTLKIIIISWMLFFGCLCFNSFSQAESDVIKEPLWEIGVVGAALYIPHYRGSDEYTWWALPMPYFIYRGDVIRATREGVRGIFFDSADFESSISVFGNPPVPDDNEARQGMPALDALFEIGPSLKWFMLGRNPIKKLYLMGSLRAASSINFDGGVNLEYQGFNAELNLIYHNRQFYKSCGFKYFLKAGLNMADNKLNSYFYDVPAMYVTPERSAFESGGGYAGFSLSASIQQDITENISIGFYSRWDNLNGAVYADSPLVREDNNVVAGCALIWKMARSKHKVESDE